MHRSKTVWAAAAFGYALSGSLVEISAGPLSTNDPSPITKVERQTRTGYPNGPCTEIKKACRRAGFVPGGAGAGVGLAVDCMQPIIEGTPQPRRATLPLPQIDLHSLTACKASLGNVPGSGSGSDARSIDHHAPPVSSGPPGNQPPGGAPPPPESGSSDGGPPP